VSFFTSIVLGQVTAAAYLEIVHNHTVSEISGQCSQFRNQLLGVTINLTPILSNANFYMILKGLRGRSSARETTFPEENALGVPFCSD
jgi:hypothetical protein